MLFNLQSLLFLPKHPSGDKTELYLDLFLKSVETNSEREQGMEEEKKTSRVVWGHNSLCLSVKWDEIFCLSDLT